MKTSGYFNFLRNFAAILVVALVMAFGMAASASAQTCPGVYGGDGNNTTVHGRVTSTTGVFGTIDPDYGTVIPNVRHKGDLSTGIIPVQYMIVVVDEVFNGETLSPRAGVFTDADGYFTVSHLDPCASYYVYLSANQGITGTPSSIELTDPNGVYYDELQSGRYWRFSNYGDALDSLDFRVSF